MGCRKFLASLIADIGRQYNPMENDKDKDKVMDIVNPRQGYGGFIEVAAAVMCDCGEMVAVCASAPEHTKEEINKILAELPGVTTRTAKSKDCPDDAILRHASNMGHTAIKCDSCGASYIMCWELAVCRISRNVTLPWDDPESPDHPSSELSFSIKRPTSGTVH